MHALGIPTSRALAVCVTGETVARETPLPGAVLARVAASHVRVGTFQYAAMRGGPELVRRLCDHVIARHYPAAAEADNWYLAPLESVLDAHASLIAHWMQVGFIHGVMNTDNMAISGETIDHGPCAFMEAFDPATVFSSIDHGGRYAYGDQPTIAGWNLTRFAETLLPLLDEDQDAAVATATELIGSFPVRYDARWRAGMYGKLGLASTEPGADALIDDLLTLLRDQRVDFTYALRALSSAVRGTGTDLAHGLMTQLTMTAGPRAGRPRWPARRETRLRSPTPWTPATRSTSPATTSSRKHSPPPRAAISFPSATSCISSLTRLSRGRATSVTPNPPPTRSGPTRPSAAPDAGPATA